MLIAQIYRLSQDTYANTMPTSVISYICLATQ